MPDHRSNSAPPDPAAVARALCRAYKELVELVEQILPPAPSVPAFIPTIFQRAILDALENKALRTDALASKVGSRSRLFADAGGLPELQKQGLVCHHRSIGFYRPDAPPSVVGEWEGVKSRVSRVEGQATKVSGQGPPSGGRKSPE